MILDQENLLSDAQALTATAISTNVIDLGPFGGYPTANTFRDIGIGKPVWLFVWVPTTLDSSGEAATLTITVESDDNTSLTTPTVHATSASIAEASLANGYTLEIPLPPGEYQRYLGVRYTVGTENFTGGSISAAIVTSIEKLRFYRDAVKNSAS